MAKCGQRSNRRQKKPVSARACDTRRVLDRSASTSPLPVPLGRRPCHAPAHAATDLSRPQAVPQRRSPHLSGHRARHGVGAILDGPPTHLQMRRGQALAWRSRRCGGFAAPERLVHLQPHPAWFHFLLAAVDPVAGPSVGGGPAGDCHPGRGGVGGRSKTARSSSTARARRRPIPATASSTPSATCWRWWLASCWPRGCRPGSRCCC